MADDLIYANGIDGITGEYLLAPLTPAALAAQVKASPFSDHLKQAHDAIEEPSLGLPFRLRPEIPADVGWAIVFSTRADPHAREALQPLIAHRRATIGDDLVKVLEHRPGEQWTGWLARHGTGPGNVDPHRVPYYVLLVGSPADIPFEFQYLLDVEYAVGRLDFDDEPSGYARYAEALIAGEQDAAEPRDDATAFFATRHPFDAATMLSADHLVTPLANDLRSAQPDAAPAERRIHMITGEHATKGALTELLTGNGTAGRPGLLFAATHGVGGWPRGHPDQRARHGALLCQDWPGTGQIASEHYFAAADLDARAQVAGMVAFLFACYGAGTPHRDTFRHDPGRRPRVIADAPFVAAFPKALLRAGAPAVIGHVDRAWGHSFMAAGRSQLIPFQNAIGRILAGQPVGHAMKDFDERYAALSASIASVLESIGFGRIVPDAELARLWTERNDAQSYVVLGDPAATLRIG